MDYNIMTVAVNRENIRLSEIENAIETDNMDVDDLKSIIHQMNVKLCRMCGGVRKSNAVQVAVRRKQDIMSVMRIIVAQEKRFKRSSLFTFEELTESLWNNKRDCGADKIRIYMPTIDESWGWDHIKTNSRRHATMIPLIELLDKGK